MDSTGGGPAGCNAVCHPWPASRRGFEGFATMRPPLLLAAALGFSLPAILPALAQAPAYHLQLQVNVTTDVGRGSCRVGTGVIGTYLDSAGRLPIGTPVELI